MQKLRRENLWSLEEYASRRETFRAEVINHKKVRRVALGSHAALYFEDFLTMKYQVQEMLRVERIFEPALIDEEITTYNPLVPDGNNWKATFMIEYSDVAQRRRALTQLAGVEHKVWSRVADHQIFAVANEDLARSTEEKTSAVHFLRFQLSPDVLTALQQGADIHFGINDELLACDVVVSQPTRDTLLSDLNFSDLAD